MTPLSPKADAFRFVLSTALAAASVHLIVGSMWRDTTTELARLDVFTWVLTLNVIVFAVLAGTLCIAARTIIRSHHRTQLLSFAVSGFAAVSFPPLYPILRTAIKDNGKATPLLMGLACAAVAAAIAWLAGRSESRFGPATWHRIAAGALALCCLQSTLFFVSERTVATHALMAALVVVATLAAAGRLGAGWIVAGGISLPLAVPATGLVERFLLEKAPGPATRPSVVVLVTIDTLRADAIDLRAGNQHTPNLARLAATSSNFIEARSAGPWTKPGIASLLSGLDPRVHGAVRPDTLLPRAAGSVAEDFRDLGYRTVAIGKNPNLGGRYRFDRGFQDYRITPHGYGPTIGSVLLNRLTAADDSTPGLTEQALRVLEERGDSDLFLWLHYLDPHSPWNPPAEYLDPSAPPPSDRVDDHFRIDSTCATYAGLEPSEKRRVRALYNAEVRFVDDQFGRVLRAIEETSGGDFALIVTSDHGEEFDDHGSCFHGHTLYDELLRVPLLVKAPGVPAQTISQPVSTQGVRDLLAALTSDVRLHEVEEANLITWMAEAPSGAGPQPFTFHSGTADAKSDAVATVSTVTTDRLESAIYKLITPLAGDHSPLFFDLVSDPDEQSSIRLTEDQQAARSLAEAQRRHQRQSARHREELGIDEIRLAPRQSEAMRALGYVN